MCGSDFSFSRTASDGSRETGVFHFSTEEEFEGNWIIYDDQDALTRSLLAAGGVGAAAGEREAEVRAALIDVLAPYRTADGGYRLGNAWHFLVATA